MLLLLLLCLCAAYLRFTLVDEELAKPDGGGVLFFCLRGKHRSAAAVACYLVRGTGLSAEVVMQHLVAKSAERGTRSQARFHTEHRNDFPPLAPLVRAAAIWANGHVCQRAKLRRLRHRA